jgi:trk system potassium uptake protein TrkA
MKVLIAGAGRLGTQIAQVLAAAHNEVTVIDIDDDRIAELTGRCAARLVPGDACEPSVLEEAGALTADLLVAATGEDEDNLVICLLAKRQFAVPRVVSRVNDADNGWLFDSNWGVDASVPATMPLVSLIEEAAGSADTVTLLRLSKAGVNVIETVIAPRSRAAGRVLGDIPVPPGTVAAAVIRAGVPTVPDATFRLAVGDEVLLISETADGPDLKAVFQ